MASDRANLGIRSRLRRALRAAPAAAPRPVLPAALTELGRSGPAPLVPCPEPPDGRLDVATVIPSFRRGSGGHATIAHLLRELAGRGHATSVWLEDFEGLHAHVAPAETRRRFAAFFGEGLDLHTDFAGWTGADVVLATGWQTVPRVLLLAGAGARAYLVQDHEPEFYATSAEARCAADTYGHGLHCIAASPWLAELVHSRYGAAAGHFDLAVDERIYHPGPEPRRRDLVVFYARTATPRRAVPLGLLALEELARRRPDVEIALFGGDAAAPAAFAHTNLGVLDPAALGDLYRQATVGMVFSLTNPSLTGLEMMASGLPCVELATDPMLATFGRDGPLALAEPDPLAVCAVLEGLLDSAAERDRRSRAGLELMATRSWSGAAAQVETVLRRALAAGRAEISPPAAP